MVRYLHSRAGVKRLALFLIPLAGCSLAPAERPARLLPSAVAASVTFTIIPTRPPRWRARLRASIAPRIRVPQVPLVFEPDTHGRIPFTARTARYAVRVSPSTAEIALLRPAASTRHVTHAVRRGKPVGRHRGHPAGAGDGQLLPRHPIPRRGARTFRPSVAYRFGMSTRASMWPTTAATARSSTT